MDEKFDSWTSQVKFSSKSSLFMHAKTWASACSFFLLMAPFLAQTAGAGPDCTGQDKEFRETGVARSTPVGNSPMDPRDLQDPGGNRINAQTGAKAVWNLHLECTHVSSLQFELSIRPLRAGPLGASAPQVVLTDPDGHQATIQLEISNGGTEGRVPSTGFHADQYLWGQVSSTPGDWMLSLDTRGTESYYTLHMAVWY